MCVLESSMHIILLINGIYDLSCCCGILFFSTIPGFSQLSKLHHNMFLHNQDIENPVVKRLLAYWLMTYGMIRTAAGLRHDVVMNVLSALTYFIEAFCFEYESRVGKTMIQSKVTFVSVFSFLLGLLILMQCF